MPGFKINMDFVPVPKDFIEHIMPPANAAYVKVYLYAMLLAVEGRSVKTAEIAKKLGLIESDVVNALKYWNEKGVMSGTGDSVIIKRSADEELSTASDRKSIDDITAIIEGDETLSALCSVAQEILGKTLGNNDIETLYWFYDRLGLSPEVIAMLLEYCASIGKRSMRYIEKVAITWQENNITTIDTAQAYISRMNDNNNYMSSLRKLFGITDRGLSKTERLYIESWRDELDMSEDMVALAYEYSIMAIGKLSFPYINTILKRWAEQGIRTIPDAERDHEEHKQQAAAPENELEATSDISELEKRFMSAYMDE